MKIIDTKDKLYALFNEHDYLFSSHSAKELKTKNVMLKGIPVNCDDIKKISNLLTIDNIIFTECTIGEEEIKDQILVSVNNEITFINCKFLSNQVKVFGRKSSGNFLFQGCQGIEILTIPSTDQTIVLRDTCIHTIDCLAYYDSFSDLKILMVGSSVVNFRVVGRGSSSIKFITNDSIRMIGSKVGYFSIKDAYQFEVYGLSPGSPTSESLFGEQVESLSLSAHIKNSDLTAFNFSKVHVPENCGIIFQSCDLSKADLSNIKGKYNSPYGVYMQMIECTGMEEVKLPYCHSIQEIASPDGEIVYEVTCR